MNRNVSLFGGYMLVAFRLQRVLMRRYLFVYPVLLALTSLAYAQTDSAGFPLVGDVRDPTNAGVPGAKVVIKRTGEAQEQTTTTDPTGSFRFEKVLPGSYEVQIHHEGFKTATSRIKIGSRPPAPVKIFLSVGEFRQQLTVDTRIAQVTTTTRANLDNRNQ